MARISCSAVLVWYLAVAIMMANVWLQQGIAADAAGFGGCSEVFSDLQSCQAFLTGRINTLDANCCAGARRLYQATAGADPSNRRAACSCAKPFASLVLPERVRSLPSACRISLPFTISASIDCTSIP